MKGGFVFEGRFGARWVAIRQRLTPLVAVVGLAAAANLSQAESGLYVKKDSLQQTMLATRARLQVWQAAQADARRAVQIGTWHRVALAGDTKLDGAAVTRSGIGLSSAGKRDQQPWTLCRQDGSGNPVLDRSATDYLYTTITAQRPVHLTIELSRHEQFGGFAYRPPPSGAGVRPDDALVWLNGRQTQLRDLLEGYAQVPVAKRRGWHEAALIEVALDRGENRLLVALGKGGQRSWFNAVRLTPQPVAALWAMIENDFPRFRNRLLEQVPQRWFDPADGWFSEGEEPRWEEPLLEESATDLGADGELVRRRHEGLKQVKAPASDARWLDLCVAAAELRTALHEVAALRAAIEKLGTAYPGKYPAARLLARTADLRQRLLARAAQRLDPADEPSRQLSRDFQDLRREALVAENPLLAGRRLLFVKRYTYDSNHYYDEFNIGVRQFGGNLCVLSLADGTVAEIAPQLSGGIFDRYDLSFDAGRILFNYRRCKPEGFRIYEIGVDGTGLRQITFPPDDEGLRIATYSTRSQQELEKNPWQYGHWTDDMHPCYLPDGRIVFTSTRTERSVLCGNHSLTVTNLHRINADGTGLHLLSQGALSEFCPTVMNDGRILYNRWEYVDKGAGAVQSLWAMCPDGSRSEEIYGNNITTPPVFNQARHVPDRNHLVVCLGAGHCPGNMGAILLVDLHKDKRTEEAMTLLTPGSLPQGNWGLRQHRNGQWMIDIYGPWYCDPFPLADRSCPPAGGSFFLVSCNPEGMWNHPAGYGLYLLDVFGNRVPIYSDPKISCWQAMPLEPRPVPPILVGSPQVAEGREAKEATCWSPTCIGVSTGFRPAR